MEIRGILAWLVILGLLAAVILTAAIKPQYSFSIEPAKDVLTVSGESVVTTAPDKAEIYVRIETEAETAKEAKDANAEISAKVKEALLNAGVEKTDIETSQFNLYPKQKYIEENETYITIGYVLQNVMKVTTKKVDKAGELVDVAVNAGANGIDSVYFGLTKEKRQEIEKEALAKATEIAKARAKALSEAAGVDLKKLVSVTGGSNYAPFPVFRTLATAKAPTEISPQQLEVQGNAQLVYEIGG